MTLLIDKIAQKNIETQGENYLFIYTEKYYFIILEWFRKYVDILISMYSCTVNTLK